MGNEKKNDELEDVSGGSDTEQVGFAAGSIPGVAPIITDALEDVVGGDFGPFPDSENAEEPLKDVEGGDGVQTPVGTI